MTGRQRLDHETLVALIQALKQNGVLSDAEADALLDRRDLDHAKDARRSFAEGRGPPEWAGGVDDPGNAGGNK